MGREIYKSDEDVTLLERVWQLHGEFRRNLEPIRVTPLQAGVILYLQWHMDAKLTDAAAALRVTQPTMSTVVKDLVRKRWVTRLRSVKDDRAVCLALSRQGKALAWRIEERARVVKSDLTPMKEV